MLQPTLEKEQALYQQGFSFVAGLDEAGRGAWAGPVVAAAVVLPPTPAGSPAENELLTILGNVRDSKLMTPRRRETAFDAIYDVALAVGVGISSHSCIDNRGLIYATRRAMHHAIAKLTAPPNYLLIDALPLPDIALPQLAFPKADRISLTVAAASVIAKVARDRLMIQLDACFPGYHFAKHKGYGTKAHQTALTSLAPCKIHRYSFAPIKALAVEK